MDRSATTPSMSIGDAVVDCHGEAIGTVGAIAEHSIAVEHGLLDSDAYAISASVIHSAGNGQVWLSITREELSQSATQLR